MWSTDTDAFPTLPLVSSVMSHILLGLPELALHLKYTPQRMVMSSHEMIYVKTYCFQAHGRPTEKQPDSRGVLVR